MSPTLNDDLQTCMSKNRGIAIVGLNGSGKTTLGKRVAELTGWKHMDIEAYYFYVSDVPYSSPRTREDAVALLTRDIKNCEHFILTADNCDLSDFINSLYSLIVCIKAPRDIRLSRVRKRSLDCFGSRVSEGGDMYEQEQKFFNFVASRSECGTKMWREGTECPIVFIDGEKPTEENALLIVERLKSLS